MHLRLYLPEAFEHLGDVHAQQAMINLGITYQHSTPQSMGDQWWFWNCQSVPENLPPYLSVLDIDPMRHVGWGLSENDAKSIRDFTPTE